MSPALPEAINVARCEVFLILDGMLLRIDRVGMTGLIATPGYTRSTA